MKSFILSFSLMSIYFLNSCSRSKPHSQLKTVDIQQSHVDNQGESGFCTIYGIIGLIESEMMKQGIAVNLSEEYLGYYRMRRRVMSAILNNNYNGTISEGAQGQHVLAELMNYGIVPEAVYSYKFRSSVDTNDLLQSLGKLMAVDGNRSKFISEPWRLDEWLGAVYFGVAVPPSPESTFSYRGKQYTPKTFLAEYLKFNPSDYTSIYAQKDGNVSLDEGISLAKASLLSGYATPVSFSVLNSDRSEGYWNTKCGNGICQITGGHMVLAVDFVTTGGNAGAMEESQISKVVDNSLENLIVKNSWGQDRGTVKIPGKTDEFGYDHIAYDYLQKQSELGGILDVIVPTKLLNSDLDSRLKNQFILVRDYNAPAMTSRKLPIRALGHVDSSALTWSLTKGNSETVLATSQGAKEPNFTAGEPGRYRIHASLAKNANNPEIKKSSEILVFSKLLENAEKNLILSAGNGTRNPQDGSLVVQGVNPLATKFNISLGLTFAYVPRLKSTEGATDKIISVSFKSHLSEVFSSRISLEGQTNIGFYHDFNACNVTTSNSVTCIMTLPKNVEWIDLAFTRDQSLTGMEHQFDMYDVQIGGIGLSLSEPMSDTSGILRRPISDGTGLSTASKFTSKMTFDEKTTSIDVYYEASSGQSQLSETIGVDKFDDSHLVGYRTADIDIAPGSSGEVRKVILIGKVDGAAAWKFEYLVWASPDESLTFTNGIANLASGNNDILFSSAFQRTEKDGVKFIETKPDSLKDEDAQYIAFNIKPSRNIDHYELEFDLDTERNCDFVTVWAWNSSTYKWEILPSGRMSGSGKASVSVNGSWLNNYAINIYAVFTSDNNTLSKSVALKSVKEILKK